MDRCIGRRPMLAAVTKPLAVALNRGTDPRRLTAPLAPFDSRIISGACACVGSRPKWTSTLMDGRLSCHPKRTFCSDSSLLKAWTKIDV